MKRESVSNGVPGGGLPGSGQGLVAPNRLVASNRLLKRGIAMTLALAGLLLALSAVAPVDSRAAAQYLDDAAAISTGNSFSCAVRDNGNAMCWGYDLSGSHFTAENLDNLGDGVTISVGESHGCGIRLSGQAACMGANYYGEIGDGTSLNYRSTPVSVHGLSDATAITTGNGFSCALKTGGQAVCWGYNNFGQLGDGTNTNRLTPVNVNGVSDAVAIEAGFSHACATRSSGQVVCWGANANGQLGDGTTNASATPVEVSGLGNATAISAGGSHSCAVRNSGQAVCWGFNGNGRLGDGTLDNRLVPTDVSGLGNATEIDVGVFHSCAIRSSGQSVCWGYNGYGQLGDATTTDRLTPVDVQGLAGTGSISAGRSQTCAIRTNGQALCWGQGQYGQLGYGGDANRSTPVRVRTNKPTITVTRSGAGQGTIGGAGIDCGTTCTSEATGTVNLWAQAEAGSEFVGWSGACSGNSACSLSMDEDRAVDAEFQEQPRHTLTVTRSGSGQGMVTSAQNNGLDCGTACSVQAWGQVYLYASSDHGSEFVGWTGACTGTNANSCSVTMDQARTVDAEFRELPRYTLSVTKSGSGQGNVSSGFGSNLDCGDTCSVEAYGEVQLYAQASSDSEFVGWSGVCAGAGASCYVTMDQAHTVDAEFRELPKFHLTIDKVGTGQGNVTSSAGIDCGDTCEVDAGGYVTVHAQPANGSQFVGWTGCAMSWGYDCSLLIQEDTTLTAQFDALPKYTLSVTKSGSGLGRVVSSESLDCGSVCEEEAAGYVSLEAQPDEGSEFVGWSGACTGSGECWVNMNQARAVEAMFITSEKRSLTVTKSGTGQGQVYGPEGLHCGSTCSVMAGGLVNLGAYPEQGSEFVRWTGACTGTGRWDCQVTMDQARTVDAEFRELPKHTLTVTKSGTGQGGVYGAGGLDCGSTCSAEMGGEVSLYAYPIGGSVFLGWSGACTGTDAWSCSVTMDQARSVDAEFGPAPPRTVTVSKPGSGSGRVVSVPAGIDCGSSCEAEIAGDVTLRATADPGSRFVGWSGACSGKVDCKLAWSEDDEVFATFVEIELPPDFTPPEPQVTPPPKPGGGTVYVGHQVDEESGENFFTFVNGDIGSFPGGCMPLTIDIPLNAGAGTISNVVLVHGGGTVNATAHGPGVWRAEIACVKAGDLFVRYTLTEDGNDHDYTIPLGGITLIDPQGVVYDQDEFDAAKAEGATDTEARDAAAISGATVRLQRLVSGDFVNVPSGDPGISPNVNPQITGNDGLYQWDVSEGTYRVVVSMEGYVSVTSDSVDIPPPVLDLHIPMNRVPAPQHQLTVTRAGTGHGAVASSPGGINCGSTCAAGFDENTVVALSTQASTGSTFAGWSGACSGTGTCEVTMNEAKAVTATFTLNPVPTPTHALSVTKSGTGQGSVASSPAGIDCGSTCSKQYEAGSVVTLAANAAPGSTFTGWAGACSGSGTCQVTMSEARAVSAAFTANTDPDPGTRPTPDPDPVPDKAELGPIKVTPKLLKVKRGKSGSLGVKLTNAGNADASAIKVCVKGPKKVRLPGCRGVSSLGAGKSTSVKLLVKVPKKAKKGSKVKLTISVTGTGLDKKTATATVKVG
ncbi:MAG TPA: hypothetical protein PKD76_05275 [Solirubrobacterales bacterium]|nr:hypothetical protein [Solirubrobacterales bacterium]